MLIHSELARRSTSLSLRWIRNGVAIIETTTPATHACCSQVGSRPWLTASAIADGAVFRRINILTLKGADDGETILRHHVGSNGLTRQGVVSILRSRATKAIADGHAAMEPGQDPVKALSAHSFRVGLTQDLFAAGEDGAGIALALRWSSPTTALGYARELAAGSNAAARVIGRMRRGEAKA